MRPRIGIVDYGVGNIKSVANALNAVDAKPVVSSDCDELAGCDRLILPGVGAFAHGMSSLAERGLVDFLRDQVASGKPLLGICLGMQMLAQFSTEFGLTEGLGLISGGVDEMRPPNDAAKVNFRLPNVGWLELSMTGRSSELAQQLLEPMTPGSRFYFIHSFCAEATNDQTAAPADYLGMRFAAIVGHGSVVGTQFHPEKSGPEGLKMLRNFTK